MRIYYNYTNYKNSKRATNTSHFLNMVLAYFEVFVGIGNLFGIFGLGAVFYELLEGKSVFYDLLLTFGLALLIIIVDSIVIYIHLCINYVCEKMAITDDYTLKTDDKLLILKEHKEQHLENIKFCFSRFFIYSPFILIGICTVSSLLFGLFNSKIIFSVFGAIFTILDLLLVLLIKRKLSKIHST